MIGGIFETIGKTLGVGKEKYFLELDDAAEASVKNIKESATKAAKSAVETAKEASSGVVEKAQGLVEDITGENTSTVKETAEKAKDAAQNTAKNASAKVKEVAGEAANEMDKKVAANKQPVEEKAAKGKANKAKAAKEKATKEAVAKTKAAGSLVGGDAPESASAPVVPSGPTEEELIVAAIAATSSDKTVDAQGNVVEGIKTFSTDYLMTPSRSSRRRPGPSFDPFKGMAKEVNPRLKN